MDVRRAVEGHAADGAFRGEAGGGLGVARGDQGRDGRCNGRFQRVQIGIVTDARRVTFGDELGEPGGDEGRLAQGHVLQLASGDPRLMPPEALHVVLVILQRHDVERISLITDVGMMNSSSAHHARPCRLFRP